MDNYKSADKNHYPAVLLKKVLLSNLDYGKAPCHALLPRVGEKTNTVTQVLKRGVLVISGELIKTFAVML